MINVEMYLLYVEICSVQNVATHGQVRGDKARASRVQAEVLADDSLHNLIGIYNPLDR